MAGVVAALSVVSDLARGHPPGEAIRACLLATELARRAGLDERCQGEVYYGTLMRFAGCAATSPSRSRSITIASCPEPDEPAGVTRRITRATGPR